MTPCTVLVYRTYPDVLLPLPSGGGGWWGDLAAPNSVLSLSMGRARPGRQVDSALRAVEYLVESLPIGEYPPRHSPSVGLRCPCMGGEKWTEGHDHHLSLVIMESHLIKEACQDVKRSLKAGALWRCDESIICAEKRREGLN